jgi:hypothetical protein
MFGIVLKQPFPLLACFAKAKPVPEIIQHFGRSIFCSGMSNFFNRIYRGRRRLLPTKGSVGFEIRKYKKYHDSQKSAVDFKNRDER